MENNNKKETEKKKYFDPPSGWKYGFPSVVPSSVITSKDLSKWLIKKGYPEKDVELALKYGRMWEE